MANLPDSENVDTRSLKKRIDRLEAQIAELQGDDSGLSLTRRQILAGMATATGAAAIPTAWLAATDEGTAEAQVSPNADFQIGDEDRRGDVFATLVDANSVDADEINNIGWPGKYGAVGDGTTDDSSAIQQLLNNENYIVFRPNTSYFIGSVVSLLNGDRTIILPESTTLKGDLDNTTANRVIEIGTDTASVSNIRLVGGGTIDGDSSSYSGGSQIMEDEGGALNLHNVTDAEIQVNIVNAREYGMEISHSSDVTVRDCRVQKCGNDCYSVTDGGHAKYGTSGDSVSENISFTRCWGTKALGSIFETDDGPSDLWYQGCVGRGDSPDQFRIHAHPGEVDPKNITYINCRAVVTGAGNMGYKIDSLTDGETYKFIGCESIGDTGETSSAGRAFSIAQSTLSDVLISDCTVKGTEHEYGAFIYSSGGTVSDVTIEGSVFRDCYKTGIAVLEGGSPVSNVTISDNRSYDNGRTGSSTYHQAGIAVAQLSSGTFTDVSVTGNVCHSQPYGLVRGDGSGGAGTDYVTYVANVLRNNTTASVNGTLGTNSVESANIT